MKRAPGGAGTMNTASAEAPVGGAGRDTAFFAAAALLFGISAAVTIHGALSMPMPWMRMPGQTWPGTVTAFLGMWVAMMVAMMVPSLLPMLCNYRRALRHVTPACRDQLTAVVSAGYFCIWSLLGIAIYPVGVAVAAAQTRLPAAARGAPLAAGLLVVVAGLLQLSTWKSRQLACCRGNSGLGIHAPAQSGSAFRLGLKHGLHCGCRCAAPTMILLVLGLMDLRTMALVTLAITAERLAPNGAAVARVTGVAAICAGWVLIVRA